MLGDQFGYEDLIVESGDAVEIHDIVLRASLDLARCRQEDIEPIISKTLWKMGSIGQADQAGWYLLNDPGILADIFPTLPHSQSMAHCLERRLHQLPCCLAQLDAGKTVVLYGPESLTPADGSGHAAFQDSEFQSFLLLPSTPLPAGRTVLVYSFSLTPTAWPKGIVEQGTLLGHIFASAYQRGQGQRNLQNEMKCFQKLLSISRSPMAILNGERQVLAANQSLSALLGYSEEELQQLTLDAICPQQSRREKPLQGESSLHPALANQHYERTFIRKDRSPVSVMVTIAPIDPLSPKGISLVSVEDLTKQKLTESEVDRRQIEVDELASLLVRSQETEWKRLSRDLHDDIGQRLSLVTSDISLMASQASTGSSPDAERLEALRSDLDSLCTDIHEMSHDLHSYKLQHLGLKIALKDVCRRLSTESFRVDLRTDDMEEPHSEEVALCLYRVAQEALNNALRHAHTSTVAVILTKLQNVFYLTIQDAGIGFESSACPNGLGLVSMRERIKLLGGSFRVHSLPKQGTEIWVAVPDAPEAPEPIYRC